MNKIQPPFTSPLISVVIPCYNEELFLAECLDSLSRQDFPGRLEIIVVDNNSSDRTAEVARKFDARVVFEPIRGICQARQTGTEAALGKIIISTDADTVFAPDWLSRIWNGFSEDSKIVAVAGPVKFNNAPWWGLSYARLLFDSVKYIYRISGKVWFVPGCNLAFKKDIWPGYNTKLTQGGDELDALFKLKKRGRIKYLPDNFVLTSSRRMYKGLFYNLFVTAFWFYLVDYILGSIAGRSLLGSYPAIRIKKVKVRHPWAVLGSAAAIVALVAIFFSIAQPTFAHNVAQRLGHRFDTIRHHVKWRR